VHVISVNVGTPRVVRHKGKTVTTSIFKSPIAAGERVAVRRDNIHGDCQSDLTVHGGPRKAVYVYPAEHYAYWQAELGAEFPWGMFGENLTTEGLTESEVSIGDELSIGTAQFRVTEPRMPCSKLALRFERPDMVKRFRHSDRSGFYLALEAEGELGAGDSIVHHRSEDRDLTVLDAVRLYVEQDANIDRLRRAASYPWLAAEWRHTFDRMLEGT
jgi:MOSC domain-containing protein YiiM